MKEISSVIQEIQSAFDKNNFPDEFLAAYDQIECLASHCGRETFLVQKKNSEALFIAKCYDLTVFSFSSEADLLNGIDHKGLPHYVGQFRNEKMLCIVREYVEGITLNQYLADRSLSVNEVADICTELSDILIYLHEQPRPIIHRDVKPTNIIVQPDGGLVLIDFDIARIFREGVNRDTVFFGTKGFAPPEQYGFAQTDCRADIYSFGIVLRFLLTGSVRENRNIAIHPALQAVIDKCTAFSPKDRFQSMRAVKSALHSAKRRARVVTRQIAAGAVIALVFLTLGFLLGRHTDLLRPAGPGIRFTEPLMEAAVRKQLGYDRETAITEEDLRQIKQLYIYGTEAFKEAELFYEQTIGESTRGQLASLEDIRQLPNLEELHIVNQGEMDISALSSARNLSAVEIKHSRVSDCSAIAGLKKMKHICLFDTDISDFTELERCVRLESLDVGLTPVRSMNHIGVYPLLESLTLMWLKMDSLDGLEQTKSLRAISLQYAEIADLSALLELPALDVVYAGEENFEQIKAVLKDSDVKVILG